MGRDLKTYVGIQKHTYSEPPVQAVHMLLVYVMSILARLRLNHLMVALLKVELLKVESLKIHHQAVM